MKRILIKEKLGDSHYKFIMGLGDVSIVKFALDENFSGDSDIFIVSEITISHKVKHIISTFNPHSETIDHVIRKRK